MRTEHPYNQPQPGKQFFIFIAITLGMLIAGGFIGLGLIAMMYGSDIMMQVMQMNLSNPKNVQALWVLQIVSTTLPILLIPVVFARWVVREPQAYLKTGARFAPLLLMMVFFVMLFSSPIVEVVSNLNQRMVLPQFLKDLETWMRNSEQSGQKATEALLKMDTIWDLIKSVLLVGLFTAIAEEFMFRGGMQTIFIRWTRNHHAAIWITAAIFSAFHMEFYGFLPRLMLGILFGYFAYWSGSIWPAVWGHFLNNGSAVVITYLYQHKKTDISPTDQHVFNYTGYVLSIIITVFLLYTYRNMALAGDREHN
jgi:membrane protease YdiL (CAAX protease family)